MCSQDSQSEMITMNNQNEQSKQVAVIFDSIQIMQSDDPDKIPELLLADAPDEITPQMMEQYGI